MKDEKTYVLSVVVKVRTKSVAAYIKHYKIHVNTTSSSFPFALFCKKKKTRYSFVVNTKR